MKLVYVTTSPIPYVTPILNCLQRKLDLHVVYLTPVEATYDFEDSWGTEPAFSYGFLRRSPLNRPLKLAKVDLLTYVSVGVSTELGKFNPDVVSVTSWGPQTVEPMAWARRSGRAVLLWSESTSWSGIFRGPLSTTLRRLSVSHADAFLSNGSQATEYLRILGAPSQAVVTSRLPSHLTTQADPTPLPRPGGPHFLFVGRLTARKRPVEVIQAFAAAQRQLVHATLTVVGDGPLRSQVHAVAASVGTGVRLLGRREGRELQEIYRQCDVLVHPAQREVWGLVVNEALAHGLFVIASDQVGSAYDLITPANGSIIRGDDLHGLEPALLAASDLDRTVAARRRRSEVIATCSPERMATDWARAAHLAHARGEVRRSMQRHRPRSRRGCSVRPRGAGGRSRWQG